MITKIEVNGFKSLSNFELSLNTGLNILVGPNGAGKTNIILFFEFLSSLSNGDLYSAITSAGGAGALFQKKGENKYIDFIHVKVIGCVRYADSKYFNYVYEFTIKTSLDKDVLYFNSQEFKVKSIDKFIIGESTDWDFDFIQNVKDEDSLKTSHSLKSLNTDVIKPRYIVRNNEDKSKIKTIVSQHLRKIYTSSIPLINYLYYFPEMHIINNDLRGGETFNIIPSKVKQPEDSSNPPGIRKDGSGLASTLYAMLKSRPILPRSSYFIYNDSPTYTPNTFNNIVNNVKLANKEIKDITVVNDPFNNQLIIRVIVGEGETSATLSLSAMSDGTIKWLTLITAIFTAPEIFSIEEPENFLHPWMQAEIVSIMRNSFSQKRNESFILMTTHSESLLNYAKVSEIAIVSMEDGVTSARRVGNMEILINEINNTGFGLGYYYFADAI